MYFVEVDKYFRTKSIQAGIAVVVELVFKLHVLDEKFQQFSTSDISVVAVLPNVSNRLRILDIVVSESFGYYMKMDLLLLMRP